MTTKPIARNLVRAALEKIVVNAGVGRASTQQNFEDKVLPQIIRDFSLIAGQKPHTRRARKSIAGFKIREGQIIGIKATLRRDKMVDFWNRLITIVLPRVRDFSGIDPADVDHAGSLNTGFKEQFVFPEVNPEESFHVFSLGINAVPKRSARGAAARERAIGMFRALGLPFRKDVPAGRGRNGKKS